MSGTEAITGPTPTPFDALHVLDDVFVGGSDGINQVIQTVGFEVREPKIVMGHLRNLLQSAVDIHNGVSDVGVVEGPIRLPAAGTGHKEIPTSDFARDLHEILTALGFEEVDYKYDLPALGPVASGVSEKGFRTVLVASWLPGVQLEKDIYPRVRISHARSVQDSTRILLKTAPREIFYAEDAYSETPA